MKGNWSKKLDRLILTQYKELVKKRSSFLEQLTVNLLRPGRELSSPDPKLDRGVSRSRSRPYHLEKNIIKIISIKNN